MISIKVLQINSVCGFGSTGRIMTDLYKTLIDNGDECLLVYGRGKAPVGINAIKINTDLNVKMHALYNRFTDRHAFFSKRATKNLIKVIEDYQPDIIHLHNLHGYYLHIEILFNYLSSIPTPVVWTLHDCWAFTGHCTHYDYIGCEKWLDSCYNCPLKTSYPASYFIDNSRKNYIQKKALFNSVQNLTIVTPSQWLADQVSLSFLKDKKIYVINNGIDLSVFKPTESNFRAENNLIDKFIVLGVASVWTKSKGLDYFFELSKILNDDCQIVLVGLNEKQISKLPENILGISRTDNLTQLAEIYTAADVFVNPTLEDTYPTTNLEAIACGTPVITFDTGGSTESICDSCGIVVDKGDINCLAAAIDKITNSLQLQVCPENLIERFEKKYCYNNYLNLFSTLYIADNSIF